MIENERLTCDPITNAREKPTVHQKPLDRCRFPQDMLRKLLYRYDVSERVVLQVAKRWLA